MDRHTLDTHPAMHRRMVEAYRAMTPEQKLQRVSELSLAVRQLARARIRATYPNAPERSVQLRLAALTIDRDLMVRAFDWDPRLTLPSLDPRPS